MIQFRIPYPGTPAGKKAWNECYGLNAYYAGKHWSQRKKDAEYWHCMTRAAMDRARVPKEPLLAPVVITFEWNDRLDLSNHAMMAKMIEDAMKGRIIQDDSPKWVRGIEHYFYEGDAVRVTVKVIPPVKETHD